MKLDPTPAFPGYDAKAGHIMSADNFDVIAAGRGNYDLLDNLLPGALHEIFAVGLHGDLLRQVVLYEDCWIGILAWAPANDILYHRDKWIGWTPNQRAERLQLIATNLRFLANDCHPRRQVNPDYLVLSQPAII